MGKEIDNRCLPDIWDRFKSGDKEAFAVLYNLHIDSLYHYGTKFCKDEEVIKDALQEIFIEFYLKHGKQQPLPISEWMQAFLKTGWIYLSTGLTEKLPI